MWARAARSRIRAQSIRRGVVRADSVVSGTQESALDGALDIVLQIIHAIGGDREPRVVASLDEPLLREKPDREFQVLARPAGQCLHIEDRQRWLARLGPPPRVEQFEQRQPADLLGAKVDVDVRGLRHLPAFAPELLMYDVVLRPPLWIAQNLVRLSELAEPRG